jgi:hypothetical protein
MGCNRCEEEKSEWTVPYPDVTCCLRHSYSRRWENVQVGCWLADTAAQGRFQGGFDITYLVTFSNVLNAGLLITIFT